MAWAIRARGLGKSYRLYARPIDRVRELLSPTRTAYHHELWALRDLDLEIAPGTATGLVGVNGAGKSTLLKLVAGKLRPTCGTIEIGGRISAILELGTGFQAHLTGRQNALVNALFLGQRPWEAEARLEEILAFADLGDYADQPLATYSSGMQARLGFAVLTTLDPEILVLDEALATGDAGFAEKCKAFLRKLCRSGCTTLVTSHDSGFLSETCDRALWIDHGKVREDGPPARVVRAYLNSLGQTTSNLATRPKQVLLRIEAEKRELAHAFLVHTFEWIGPSGEVMAEHHVGEERGFVECLSVVGQLGLSPASARAGWGPSQDFAQVNGWGLSRACRPDLGPGGAAYLALPVPPAPKPLPSKLRARIYQNNEPTAAILSLLANGRFRELGRLQHAEDPWQRVDLDVTACFAEEGTTAPPFDVSRVAAAGGSS